MFAPGDTYLGLTDTRAKLDRFFLTRDPEIVPTKLELPAYRYGINALEFSVSDFVTGGMT